MNVTSVTHYFRWLLLLVVLTLCVGCDQVTKQIARQTLDGRPQRSYLSDTVRLVYAENPGAFLGLGGQLPPRARWLLLVVVNTVVATGIGGFLIWHSKMPALRALACALLLGGAIGNLIDRVRFDGLVIDFMNLGIGPVRTGIFNVADVAITVGAVLLILPQLTATKPQDPTAEAA